MARGALLAGTVLSLCLVASEAKLTIRRQCEHDRVIVTRGSGATSVGLGVVRIERKGSVAGETRPVPIVVLEVARPAVAIGRELDPASVTVLAGRRSVGPVPKVQRSDWILVGARDIDPPLDHHHLRPPVPLVTAETVLQPVRRVMTRHALGLRGDGAGGRSVVAISAFGRGVRAVSGRIGMAVPAAYVEVGVVIDLGRPTRNFGRTEVAQPCEPNSLGVLLAGLRLRIPRRGEVDRPGRGLVGPLACRSQKDDEAGGQP